MQFLRAALLTTLLMVSPWALAASVTLDAVNASRVTAVIRPDAADIGRVANVWMGAIFQGRLYLRSGAAWQAYASGSLPVAIQGQVLSAATAVTVVDQLDVSQLPGVEIYVGYGTSEQEMLSAPGKLARILTVQNERATRFGSVQGNFDANHSAYAWLGIPYAAPPVGSLRWKAPIDPAAWSGVRQARQFGSACTQIGGQLGPQPTGQPFGLSLNDNWGRVVGSEDCLTLNIWSPASGETRLPVIVFIHGGSNKVGWSATPDYSGARLAAEQKVVFVSVNYRLNLFGWLNHPALKTGDAESDSGNFGTLDLIQALRFVRDNIAAFGGDSANITVAGQSAGAVDTFSLIVSPRASGLFHKAVALSGYQSGQLPATATNFATALLQQLVINDGLASDAAGADAYLANMLPTDAARRTYLYGKSAAALGTAFSNAAVSTLFVAPIYDGVVQPPNPTVAFTGNYLNNVPVLAGLTNEEGKYWGPIYASNAGAYGTSLWSRMWTFNPDNPSATPVALGDIVAAAYLPANKAYGSCSNTGYNAYTQYCNNNYNTAVFWNLQSATLNRVQAIQPRTWAYNFTWARQPEPWKTLYGSAHVSDMAFLFGNFGPGLFSAGYSSQNAPGREALSSRMRRSLYAFMSSGDPNHASLGVTWLPWSQSAGGAKRLLFGADDTGASVSMSTAQSPESLP